MPKSSRINLQLLYCQIKNHVKIRFKYLIICCLIRKGGRIQKQISVCNCFLHQIKNRIITLTQLEKRSTGENYYVDLSADNCPPQSEDNKQRGRLHRRGRCARISEPSHSHKACVKTMLAASSTKCSLDILSFLDRSSLNHSVVMGVFLITACCTNCFSRWWVPVVGRRSTCDPVRAPLAGKKRLAN